MEIPALLRDSPRTLAEEWRFNDTLGGLKHKVQFFQAFAIQPL